VPRVLQEKVAHVVAVRAVVIDRLAPGRLVAVREIRAEVAQVIPLGPQMVVDHVQDHGQPRGVAGVDEVLEPLRAAVGMLHRENVRSVVSPVAIAWKLPDRHDFNRGYSQFNQVAKARDGCLEGSPAGEGADMDFVENKVRHARRSKYPLAPAVGSVVHHRRRAVHVVRLMVRGGVRPGDAAVQTVTVQVPRREPFGLHLPIAVRKFSMGRNAAPGATISSSTCFALGAQTRKTNPSPDRKCPISGGVI